MCTNKDENKIAKLSKVEEDKKTSQWEPLQPVRTLTDIGTFDGFRKSCHRFDNVNKAILLFNLRNNIAYQMESNTYQREDEKLRYNQECK